MKGLIVLLSALVAVQARSTALTKSGSTEAALGENPWVVHLRIAVSTSGLLETCAGTLIDESWVLTARDCVSDSRFIWIRYGAINIVNPELVTENSIVRLEPTGANMAIISINRVVHSTANISPAGLTTPDAAIPETATYCTYNDPQVEGPGEILACADVKPELTEGGQLVAAVDATPYDLGAGLVKDGVLYGLLSGFGEAEATFVRPGEFLEWIERETGIDFRSKSPVVMPEELVNFDN